MENYILQKKQKWPKSWDIHIINSCKLYFEDKNINFIDGYINEIAIVAALNISNPSHPTHGGLNLNIFFATKDNYNYSASLYKNNDNIIYGEVCYETFEPYIPEESNTIDCSQFINYTYLIAKIKEKTSFDIVKQLEKIIKNDYEDRKKDDNNDGNGGNEEDPVEPDDPIDKLDLTPSYSSST